MIERQPEKDSNLPEAKKQPYTTLYVLIPPYPLFAAHWSLYLPTIGPYNTLSQRHEKFPSGRRIQVSGDRLHGFELEIIHDYNIRQHKSVPASRKYPIGRVGGEFLVPRTTGDGRGKVKDEDEGGGFVSDVPVDAVCRPRDRV
ncbi:hypothetical protein EJ03DRAFT_216925 [Teratosphaeria nubilosa]|uniref:Uncharacterized protein n=1 Tax=Teratosphaeria nubilosa TaxID=161662 RepID=A0A6G1LGY9_9PEZI|nr:hypothetical protein EJ03DRAFT_216925 [Teratosphaeria nubilosa]